MKNFRTHINIIAVLFVLGLSSCNNEDGIISKHETEKKDCKNPAKCWYYWKGIGTPVSDGVHGGTTGEMDCGMKIGDQWIDEDGMVCEITSEGHILAK